MILRKSLAVLILLFCLPYSYAQVAITNYSVNSIGQAQLSIQGQAVNITCSMHSTAQALIGLLPLQWVLAVPWLFLNPVPPTL